jgi:hypothetical protein
MQTFTDFINQRFGFKENFDQNQQKVPSKMEKKVNRLKTIIGFILENPNYFKKFVDVTKEFVEEIRDEHLKREIENFEEENKDDEEDKGLAQETGILDRANNLPPNMGG